jgi:DNA primase
MPRFSQESVQRLRDAVDIVEVISRYVPLKKAGAAYKGLCPFHDEKTPSFTVQKSSRHYHCFGCGAHGDAVAFLMQYERMSFQQALEALAERCNVTLEISASSEEERGMPKAKLRTALEEARRFFHAFLLHSDEAAEARAYLQKRGFSLEFIRTFSVGCAPHSSGFLLSFLAARGITEQEALEAGLVTKYSSGSREFFLDRIMFPILDALGNTIGFSARKWKEITPGGKYINTAETKLFKKSKVFFGLFYSKKRIVRDRTACIVEGQLDALRLIEAGYDFTVATLGTAFGLAHAEQLKALGVEDVYLAFDQDEAGKASAEKAGHILTQKGFRVRVVGFEGAKDPDELLQHGGADAFFRALSSSMEFTPFLVQQAKVAFDWSIPVEKDRAIRGLVQKIREWGSSVLIRETYRQLASLCDVPLEFFEVPAVSVPTVPVPMRNEVGAELLLELDLIRWLIAAGTDQPDIIHSCQQNISEDDFRSDVARRLYARAMESFSRHQKVDFFSFAEDANTEELSSAVAVLLEKKTSLEKAQPTLLRIIKMIKERNWLMARENIRKQMELPGKTEQELFVLAKQFDDMAKSPPVIVMPTVS